MARFCTFLLILLYFVAEASFTHISKDSGPPLEAELSLESSELGEEEKEMNETEVGSTPSGDGDDLGLLDGDDEWMVDSSYICAAEFVHNAQILTSGSTLRVEFSSFNTNDGFRCYLDGKLVEEECFSPLVLRQVSKGEHQLKILPNGCEETEPSHGRLITFSLT